MPWGQRNVTIKDLTGIEDDDFKTQLAAGKTAAAKAAEVSTQLGEFKTTAQQQFDEVKNMLKTLTERSQPTVPTNTSTDGNSNSSDGGGGDANIPSFSDDAVAAFNHRFQKGVEPLLVGQIDLSTQIALGSLQDKHGEMFKALKDDMLKEIRLKGPGFFATHKSTDGKFDGVNGGVQEIFDLVRGRNMDQIMQDRDKKQGRFYVESGSAGGSGGSINTNTGSSGEGEKRTITPEEREYIKRIGLSEEKFLEGHKKFEKQILNGEASYI